jgi:hypothetical protein
LIDKDYASACFVVYGAIRAIDFPVDSKLVSPEAGNTFTVVDSKDGQLLIASDSTRGLEIDQILYSVSNNVSFSVTDLIEPDFDVFSGTVCSINNQSPFTHSDNQTLELVTYLVFEDVASLSRTKMPESEILPPTPVSSSNVVFGGNDVVLNGNSIIFRMPT